MIVWVGNVCGFEGWLVKFDFVCLFVCVSNCEL